MIGLEVAGVDMLESNDGPKVMELNSSPGFEGLEQRPGRTSPGAIIDRALALARARDVATRRAL